MNELSGDVSNDLSPVTPTFEKHVGPRIAIVTDGMWRKSLSAIRSLGKAGFGVHVLGDSWLTVGFWSHFTKQRVLVPDPKEDSVGFGNVLSSHLKSVVRNLPPGVRPVLLPMEEDSLRYVVNQREPLHAYADFLVPEPEALEVCLNKADTMALAERLGIPHPRTIVTHSATDLLEVGGHFLGSEFVVKPLRGIGARGVRYNPRFEKGTAEEYFQTYGPALAQDRIPPEGDAVGVSLLFGADGSCLAHFCHKRLQQFPNSGGPSTDRVGIDSPGLLEHSLKLMRALNWKGIAMVEWKIDPRDGSAKLMEINPRFWGSLELAIRSGVNFPLLYAEASTGRSQKYSQATQTVRCRWLIPGDILRWFTAERSAREPLGKFLSGLPAQAEEWDTRDFSGFISCIVCQGLAVLQPKYWKFLSR
jgi:predicted ATP-grasp superfamily ATP-dependent carboligase